MTTATNMPCPQCGAPLTGGHRGDGCSACLMSLAESALQELKGTKEACADDFPRKFGSYELLGELARGGMGVVYRARDTLTQRWVALKMIRSQHLADQSEVERFQREAEAAARLDHPNIVPVYEVGLHEGQHYFTMKLVEGGSLRESLERRSKPMSQRDIARLMLSVARAVECAHRNGILHRDLKPSNILMDAEGKPYVSDFGLAKLIFGDSHVTLSDLVLGTAPYMSPEQAAGKSREVTASTDVWALGVILYQLLSNQLPFPGTNHLETLRVIQEQEPQPFPTLPAVDKGLGSISLKCLQKNPRQRYPSAEALADELEAWLENRPISAKPDAPLERLLKWARRSPVKAAAVVAAAGASLFAIIITNSVNTWRVPKVWSQHMVVNANTDGLFLLRVKPYKEDRLTENIWRFGFEGDRGQWLRLDYMGIPPELASTLPCRIRVDIPRQPDPIVSDVLTNGQRFFLRIPDEAPGNFYVAAAGWHSTNLLATHGWAAIRLTLLSNRLDYISMEVRSIADHPVTEVK